MPTPEEEYKAKMLAKHGIDVNADWQKQVLEASISGTALPEFPREMQLKALMQAELVKVSQQGLFKPAQADHKITSPTPKPRPKA